MGGGLQAQPHRLAHLHQPRHLIGVGRAQGKGRQRHLALDIAGRARVRHAVLVRPGRAHHEGDRAALGGFGRAHAANARQGAIARAVLHPHHLPAVDDRNLAVQRPDRRGQQGVQPVEEDHIGLDALSGRGDGMAQGGGDQLLRAGAQQLGALLAPLPAHQRELFDADVLEAVGAHIVGGPVGGRLFRARTRRARAETGRDLGDVVEGDVGLQRRVAHLLGGADGRGVLRHNRRGDQAERQRAGGHQTGVE
ncbi:hypothetical protein D3C85_831660 [compost metagenome]